MYTIRKNFNFKIQCVLLASTVSHELIRVQLLVKFLSSIYDSYFVLAVDITRRLNDVKLIESQSFELVAEVNNAAIEGNWTKDGVPLQPSDRVMVSSCRFSSITIQKTSYIGAASTATPSLAKLPRKFIPYMTTSKSLQFNCFKWLSK